uniref:Uncharacterized protein n=1 Tax=Setaria italica TaxID=4555 RepID=K3Z1Y6_SETIT
MVKWANVEKDQRMIPNSKACEISVQRVRAQSKRGVSVLCTWRMPCSKSKTWNTFCL